HLAPTEGRAGRRELLAGGAIVLLGMERAVLAHRVLEEEIEHRPGGVSHLAVAVRDRRCARLAVLADRRLGLPEEGRAIGGLDRLQFRGKGMRLPVEEVAASPHAV